jgi:hypothetical protein
MFATDAMAAADRRHQSRSRLLGLELTLAISAAAWLAAPTAARALPQTDYVLSNVSAVFGGTRESISGVFTVGVGDEWYAQFDGSTCSLCVTGGNIVHAIPVNGNTIVTDGWQITFSSDFSSVTSIKSTVGAGITGTDVTGGAVATASPLEYTFANAATVLNGTPETITGHFGYDPLTLIQYGADIQLTVGPHTPAHISPTPNYWAAVTLSRRRAPGQNSYIYCSRISCRSSTTPLPMFRV